MDKEDDWDSQGVKANDTHLHKLVIHLQELEGILQALIDSQANGGYPVDIPSVDLLRKAQEALRQSDELLETIFSSNQNCIAYLDRDFNFIRVNRTYAEIDGREPDFFVGKNHFDLYPHEENASIFRRVVDTGIPYHVYGKPFTYPEHPERGVTYWDWSLQPIRNKEGEISGVLLNLINVTERVQAESALHDSKIMFERLFESAPDANILTDSTGRILAVNHKVEEQFGYRRDELIGASIELLIPERYRAGHRKHTSTFVHSPRVRPMGTGLELCGVTKNGREFPADISLTPLETASGVMILSVIRDITLRKKAEDELREKTEFVRLLQDIAVASNEAQNIESALQYAITRVCRHTRWPVGHALLLDQPQNAMISTHIWHLDDPDAYRVFCEASENRIFPEGTGLPGTVLEAKVPSWITDVTIDPAFTRLSSAKKVGLRGAFAFPVLVGKQVVGVLEFFSSKVEEPNTALLDIMRHVGAQLGRVIERAKNQGDLEKQGALLRTVLDTLPVGIWVADEKGKIVSANPAGLRIWGGTKFVGPDQFAEYKAWWHKTGQPIKPEEWGLARAVTNGETSVDEIIEIETFDGARKIVYNSALPLRDANGRIIGAIAVNQDITERKQLEAELAEVQRRLLDSVEKERSRLAQDLHDGPIQDLYGVNFQIQALRGNITHPEGEAFLDRTAEMVQAVISSLRTTMSELKPPSLSHFGLSKAIRSHAEQFQYQNPEIDVHLDLAEDNNYLKEQERLALFRNYQQLLSNTLRHAQATNVWVRFKIEPRYTILEIQDDGKGFTKPQRWIEFARRGHLGLVGASERAEALGGRIEIHSRPGKGTLIRTILPHRGS